ncbi:MAG: DUF86 domain-containing protein [Kiritimatiellae bacterium]|jgi:uncharacterized protein YutE (UPF0331/DUF86 family)|nr:DUF86 domain-containing protein [Kiritimatiellia bacterium]
MDDVVLRKFDTVTRCLTRVIEHTPATLEILLEDYTRQDVIVLNLERAVQACVDIGLHVFSKRSEPVPDSMGEVFARLGRIGIIDEATAVALKGAVGFRNVAVHAYTEIDYAVLFSICTRHLDDFRSFARQILDAMEKDKTV